MEFIQATSESERGRHAGIPPRDEEEMEMSDDSSTLTGESLEAVSPAITPRYSTQKNVCPMFIFAPFAPIGNWKIFHFQCFFDRSTTILGEY